MLGISFGFGRHVGQCADFVLPSGREQKNIVSFIKRQNTMEVKIQIPDGAYAQLLNSPCRMRGSIALISPTLVTFNPHRNTPKAQRQFMRLPHGRVSIGQHDVRMSLCIERCEAVLPAKAIEQESRVASSFIDLMEEQA